MDIIKFQNTKEQKEDIVKALKLGKVIVFATETSYGLGADAKNKFAVEKIAKIKNRALNKQWPLIASSLGQVQEYARVIDVEKALAIENWPGSYTIVFARKSLHDELVQQGETLAMRVSSNKNACYFAAALGNPIVSTSANLSGNPSIYNSDDIISEFENALIKPDLFIDSGDLPFNNPSTIVQVGKDGVVNIIRN